jgi:acyl-ACP thioesterase
MIDTDTRQPTDILSIHDGLILKYVETEKECPIERSSRVKMGDDAKLVRSINTYYNDVDVNGHINSVKYIEHVLDLFPLEWYEEYKLNRLDIAYVAESHQGDVLNFYQEEVVSDGDMKNNEKVFQIRITKTSQKYVEGVEVVRCMVKFVKD